MPLQRTDKILRHRLYQHGLGELALAGALCRQAELLFPNQFKAISLREHVMHIQVSELKLLAFKHIQGKLQNELNLFAVSRQLPSVERFKLTISE